MGVRPVKVVAVELKIASSSAKPVGGASTVGFQFVSRERSEVEPTQVNDAEIREVWATTKATATRQAKFFIFGNITDKNLRQ